MVSDLDGCGLYAKLAAIQAKYWGDAMPSEVPEAIRAAEKVAQGRFDELDESECDLLHLALGECDGKDDELKAMYTRLADLYYALRDERLELLGHSI